MERLKVEETKWVREDTAIPVHSNDAHLITRNTKVVK